MKWRSKDNKQELDLDKIGYWCYTSVEDVKTKNQQATIQSTSDSGGFYPVSKEISTLEVYMGGDGPLLFYGEEADDIYNKLLSKREVL